MSYYRTAARAGLLALAITLAATACGSNDQPSGTDSASPAAVDYASAERTGLAIADRVKTYTSTQQLLDDSTLVVVATGTGAVSSDTATDEASPVAITTVVVKRVIAGAGYRTGDEVPVFVEGSRDKDGQLRQDKIKANKSYVLYLTPLRPDVPDSKVFAVTGYLAGMFEEVAPDQYGRVDPESPNLPIGLDLSGSRIREIAH